MALCTRSLRRRRSCTTLANHRQRCGSEHLYLHATTGKSNPTKLNRPPRKTGWLCSALPGVAWTSQPCVEASRSETPCAACSSHGKQRLLWSHAHRHPPRQSASNLTGKKRAFVAACQRLVMQRNDIHARGANSHLQGFARSQEFWLVEFSTCPRRTESRCLQ